MAPEQHKTQRRLGTARLCSAYSRLAPRHAKMIGKLELALLESSSRHLGESAARKASRVNVGPRSGQPTMHRHQWSFQHASLTSFHDKDSARKLKFLQEIDMAHKSFLSSFGMN